MSKPPAVVTVHAATGISGVSVAGARLSRLPAPHTPWRPLLVGPALTPDLIGASALADAPGLAVATWPQGADPVEQVLIVRDTLRAIAPDVVVGNDSPHAYIAAALDQPRGPRLLAWHHSSGHDGDDVVLGCFPLADAWAAVSTSLSQHARTLGADLPPDLGPVPVCVTVPPRPAPPLGTGSFLRLFFAGRLEKHHKRVLDLALLADELTGRGVAFRMTIAGDGPAADELRTALTKHLRCGRVSMIGRQPAAEMSRLYAAHDFTLLVSEREGWPLAVAESLAMGRPVAITQGCGGALDVVQDGVNGIIAPIGDMHVLAGKLHALHQLHADAASRAAMGIAAHASIAAHSAEALGACYDRMIARTLAQPCRAGLDSPARAQRNWDRILGALAMLGPCPRSAVERLREVWTVGRAATGGVSAFPLEIPPIVCTAERAVRAAADELLDRGVRRIAIYGAGRHTLRAAAAVRTCPQIIAILDDRAGDPQGPPREFLGLPVALPAIAARLGVQAVVISSDEHEREMAVRARGWAGGLEVVTLYESLGRSRRAAA